MEHKASKRAPDAMAQKIPFVNRVSGAIGVSNQFKRSIETLNLLEAFTLQRALWKRDPPDSIARNIGIDTEQVKHAYIVVEQERERVDSESIGRLFPWCQEVGFLQSARAMGIFKRQLEYLRRNPDKIFRALQLPPALAPNGLLLEHACTLLEFLHKQVFDVSWTVTICRAPPIMQMKGRPEITAEVAGVLARVASRIEIVEAPQIEVDEKGIRVALSRPDMASAPGLGDAIQAAALVSIMHYRVICHEHALFTPQPFSRKG